MTWTSAACTAASRVQRRGRRRRRERPSGEATWASGAARVRLHLAGEPAPRGRGEPEHGAAAVLAVADQHAVAGGSLDGYKYRYRLVPASTAADAVFELAAQPEEYGKTGRRSFLMDSAGKVHGADKKGGVVTAQDPVVDTGAGDTDAGKP